MPELIVSEGYKVIGDGTTVTPQAHQILPGEKSKISPRDARLLAETVVRQQGCPISPPVLTRRTRALGVCLFLACVGDRGEDGSTAKNYDE